MAVNKTRVTVLTSVNVVIIFLTFFGMMPFSLISYKRHKVLKTSIFGNIYSIFFIVNGSVQYHWETLANIYGENRDSGMLTILVSLVIMYMEPILMVCDGVSFLINQKKIIVLINRMEKMNEKLIRENIEVNLGVVRKVSIIITSAITIIEIGLVTYNYIVFEDAIWFIPIYLSTVAKVFYVALVYTIKLYLTGINQQLQTTKVYFEEAKLLKRKRLNNKLETDDIGYLHKEILIKRTKAGKRRIVTVDDGSKVVNVIPYDENDKKILNDEEPFSIDSKEICIDKKMDKKIKNLCKMHDDICDIARKINGMFSFQMLLLIAYGFMAITARIYFMYCSLVGQIIPVVFRAAESALVSCIYLVYSSAKCVVVVLVSYKTKQVAQRTGIYLHKVANAVDEDHLYETVNHLSLKLLNHSIRFCACGFFDLDMATLYGITGAITSYIILLIQFNLAGLRVKKPNELRNETFVSNSSALETQ